MRTTAHALLSAVIGSGLAAYTVISFLSDGFAASGAVLGLSFLAVYGVLEMALIEYVPLGGGNGNLRRPARPAPSGTMVEFPEAASSRRAA